MLRVYRIPSAIINVFHHVLGNDISTKFLATEKVIFEGDSNVDLLSNSEFGIDFVTEFQNNGYNSLLIKTTRVTMDGASSTSIIHFCSNSQMRSLNGIFNVHISDHFHIFAVTHVNNISVKQYFYF